MITTGKKVLVIMLKYPKNRKRLNLEIENIKLRIKHSTKLDLYVFLLNLLIPICPKNRCQGRRQS